MLSPVTSTTSGSRPANAATQRCLRSCPGVKCRSDRCSTRSGSASGESTGTSNRRSVNRLRSMSEAYASVAAPATTTPAAIFPSEPMGTRVVSYLMTTLKDRLTTDMRAAMKARDEVTTSTLRMALAAVGVAEVAGDVKRELSDDEV